MSVHTPGRCRGYGVTEWTLLSVAVVFALVFATAVAYLGYAFLFSLSRGFEEAPGAAGVFALLLPVSLVVSIVASVSLVWLQKKHRREAC